MVGDCMKDELTEDWVKAYNMKPEDYGYCETCDMFFDLWRYGSVEDAGHAEHAWRFVTAEELVACVKECLDMGCFDE